MLDCPYSRYHVGIVSLTDDGQVKSYHIHVKDHKWQELVKKDDLRFFKHNRYVVDNLKKYKNDGVVLKICHWNSSSLHNDFMISKKIKHLNFSKYICYFEYEEDIINFLMCDDFMEDVYDDNAVVILPAFSFNIREKLDLIDSTKKIDIIKQIILSLYYLLYSHHISLTNISASDIYIDIKTKLTNLKYEFRGYKYKLQTKQVVKLDVYRHVQESSEIRPEHYRQLYNNILKVLKVLQFNEELQEFIKGFVSHNNNERIVCPLKMIDSIISRSSVF